MSIAFIHRPPTEKELENFRLYLSSYGDRIGQIIYYPFFEAEYLTSYPAFYEEVVTAAFNLPIIASNNNFSVIDGESSGTYVSIGLRGSWKRNLVDNDSLVDTSSFSGLEFWDHLAQFNIDKGNCLENPKETGIASVKLLEDLISRGRFANYKIDVYNSFYLVLFGIVENKHKMQLVKYPFLVDPNELNWCFEQEAGFYQFLRGYKGSNMLYEVRMPKVIDEKYKRTKTRGINPNLSLFDDIDVKYCLHDAISEFSHDFELESLSAFQLMEYGVRTSIRKHREMALAKLEELVNDDALERHIQKLLAENSWILGSEYGKLLQRRILVRDNQQDFILKRTADGFLETIEIKRPMNNTKLFNEDDSHETLYPGKELSKAIGQVMHYIEEIESDRHRIRSVDGEDVSKIRAKLVIGRDGDEYQVQALRILNSHLYRIEILTYDQLIRIAQKVLEYQ